MTKKPKVSVIIPTFNRARFIRDAIESVLAQTFQYYEIIVVDDGSTDGTVNVIEPFKNKIKYVYQKNQGVSAARNNGIKHSQGEFIAFLDSDDMWVPDKLEKQVAILNKYDDISLVYSNLNYCDESCNFIRTAFKPRLFQEGFIPEKVLLWKVNCGYLQTWLIRKKCFDEIGYLDTSFKMSEDREMSIRVAINYKIYGLSEPLTVLRLHNPEERLGRSPAEIREGYYFKFLDLLFEKYGHLEVVKKNRKKLFAGYFLNAGKLYLRDKELATARTRFLQSIKYNHWQLRVYPYLFSALLGHKVFNLIYTIRKLLFVHYIKLKN